MEKLEGDKDMTEAELNKLQVEDVVDTSKVVEKPKKTTAKKTTKKEEVKTEVVKEEPVNDTGVVSDCYFLRIRKAPVVEDNVIKEIKAGTEVTILETTDNGFYKIRTKAGDEGFCMSEFIHR